MKRRVTKGHDEIFSVAGHYQENLPLAKSHMGLAGRMDNQMRNMN